MAGTSSTVSVPMTPKHMDRSLFKVIMKDNKDELKEMGDQLIKHQITPNGNTALHVAAQYEKANCAVEILKLCSSLLLQPNNLGETALHLAAKRGNSTIVEALIESACNNNDIEREGKVASELLIRKISENKDTALHEAVKYNWFKVVEFLLLNDPDFRYLPNKHGETPLYLAARKGFDKVALKILEKSKSPSYEGPRGRTALHAAVASDLKELCDQILGKMPGLADVADEKKWTPLHVAARFDRAKVVEKLVSSDTGCAYMRDDEGMTPLHIAAKEGHTSFIAKLLDWCPDCYEMVDNDGRNALHIAAERGMKSTVEAILKHPQFSGLINEGDNKGDTPLHLLAKSRKYIRSFLKRKDLDKAAVNYDHLTALDILPRTSLSSPDAVDYFRLKLTGVTPTGFGVAANNSKQADKVVGDNSEVHDELVDDKNRPHMDIGKDDVVTRILDRMYENHILVVTLIATVTFAAGFTLPGGYNDDQGPHVGTATLVRKSAFQAFVISDTIALLCSLCAVFTHFLRVMKIDKTFDACGSGLAASLTGIAMIAMAIAYVTGTFVVLTQSLGLAIVNSVIGCLFFAYVFVLFINAFRN